MLDRESTFADPKIIALLQDKFIPVAIDQFNQIRQKDSEGEFWRQLIRQGPRNDLNETTQGFYVASPSGKLYAYNNNRGPEKIRTLMEKALKRHQPSKKVALMEGKRDPDYDKSPPKGATVIRVHAKVLGGYEEPTNKWEGIFQKAVSRDTLWITQEEIRDLKSGKVSDSLGRRIARYHLIDNTRGEPTFWRTEDVREAQWQLERGVLKGRVRLERANGDSGYDVTVLGKIAFEGERLTRFDLVAKGDYWGAGRYTLKPPAGKFPLAVSFRLPTEPTVFDTIAPQGTKGWSDYLKSR